MSTADRLREAVEKYPGGPRAFQRQVRHIGRIAGSWYAVQRYLTGERPIPGSFVVAAAGVLKVPVESLTGETRRTIKDSHATGTVSREEARGAAQAASGPDPFADIRTVVTNAGATPPEDALRVLDPRYPRDGLTLRNWGILHASVAEGKGPKEIAAEIGLSAARIAAIRDEYAALVRDAAGVGG